jgi:hypothetical protein
MSRVPEGEWHAIEITSHVKGEGASLQIVDDTGHIIVCWDGPIDDQDRANAAILVMAVNAYTWEGPETGTRRLATFTVEYNYFEPGTRVTPTSVRSVLEEGQVYTIKKCFHPLYADDRACCYVEGRETGLSSEYLREIQPGESP